MKYIISESCLTQIANKAKAAIGLSPDTKITTSEIINIVKNLSGGKEFESIADAYEALEEQKDSAIGYVYGDSVEHLYCYEEVSDGIYSLCSAYNGDIFNVENNYNLYWNFELVNYYSMGTRIIDDYGDTVDFKDGTLIWIGEGSHNIGYVKPVDIYNTMIVATAAYGGGYNTEVHNFDESGSYTLYLDGRTYIISRN